MLDGHRQEGNCRKAAWAGAATSPTPARFGSEDRNKYCSNLTKPLLPSCPLPARGRTESGDQGPLLDSMSEPEPAERSLLPGPAATVGTRSLMVPGGAGSIPGCPGGSKGRGPGGGWQEPCRRRVLRSAVNLAPHPAGPAPGRGHRCPPGPGVQVTGAPRAPRRAVPQAERAAPPRSRTALPPVAPSLPGGCTRPAPTDTRDERAGTPTRGALCEGWGGGGLHGGTGAPRTAAGTRQEPHPQPIPATPGAAPLTKPRAVPPHPNIFPPVGAAGRGEGWGAWPGVANRCGALRKFPFMARRRRPRPDIRRARAAGGSRRELCLPSQRARPAPAAASRPPRLRPRQLPKGESGTATAGDRTVTIRMTIATSRCYCEYRRDRGCWDAARPLCAGGVAAP